MEASRGGRALFVACLVFFFCAVVAIGVVDARRAVGVELVAAWDATPLHLEAAEFFAEETSQGFWAVVDGLHPGAAEDTDDTATTEETLYGKVMQLANALLPSSSKRLLHYALLSRYYSPKVEMFRQYSRGQAEHCRNAAWVHAGTHMLCTPEEVQRYLEQPNRNESGSVPEATLVFGDQEHLFPNAAPSSAPLLVLYGQVGSSKFTQYHSVIRVAASASTVRYAVRHYTPEEPAKRLMNVQGYGVELAIKSTEYKVIDDKVPEKDQDGDDEQQSGQEQDTTIEGFQFDKLKQRKPELATELDAFKEHLEMVSQQNEGFQQLRAWQIKSLGYQAAQRIMSAGEPLQLLRDIAHNFPPIANSLARLRVDADIRSEIEDNQEQLAGLHHLPGNFINMNGRNLAADQLSPYVLYEFIKDELSKLDALSVFGLGRKDSEKLLSLVPSTPTIRFDLRDREVFPSGGTPATDDPNNVNGAIQFANNLEKDAMYGHWPGIHALLQPVYPGQMRYIKKNIQTMILVIDPSSPQGLSVIGNFLYMLRQGLPFRVGFVFSSGSTTESASTWEHSAENLAKLAKGESGDASQGSTESADNAPLPENLAATIIKTYFLLKQRSGEGVRPLDFFGFLGQSEEEATEVTEERVWQAFAAFMHQQGGSITQSEWREGMKSEAVATEYRTMQRYIEQKGIALLDRGSQYIFTNGKFQQIPADSSVGSALQNLLMQETFYGYSRFQEAAYKRELQHVDDLWSWILQESSPVFDRFSSLIFQTTGEDENGWVSLARHRELLAPATAYLSFPASEFNLKEYTHLVVGDLTTRPGLTQALEAVMRLAEEGSEKVRVGFLHNTEQDSQQVPPERRENEFLVARALQAALTSGKTLKRVFPFVTRLLATALAVGPENVRAAHIEELALAAELKDLPALMSKTVAAAYAQFERDRNLASSALGLLPGQRAVVTNGKVTRLPDQVMLVQDLKLLEAFEGLARVDQIRATLDGVSEHFGVDPDDLTSEFYSNELAAAVSVLSAETASSEQRVNLPQLTPSFVAGEQNDPTLKIVAVLDPLSKGAQQIAPLLLSLVNNDMGIQVQVVLNPKRDLTELPLKTFYRYVLQDELVFDAAGRLARKGEAVFNNLPTSLLLTMNMDTPHSWVVQAVRSVYDLDNILLKDMGKETRLSATFELQHILAEGTPCIDVDKGSPAVGLQINLGNHQQSHITDTTVMANLGYFQLKANPGLWWLSLGKRFGDEQQEGVSPYQLLSTDGRTPVPRLAAKIDRFTNTEYLQPYKVKRGAAQQVEGTKEELAKQDGGMWGQWMSYFQDSQKDTAEAEAKKDETIHIFSVASGHLYERFLKIMMLTVLKNTKSPVKFWFLENYLSPKFKEYAPVFSQAYNTSIELVTYQWPSWLHHETEKQRVIWGYKILFLDVLFPMDLRKVIFVDADQIVRTDLKELYDMDLKGAPLAYTPFCSSRTEMNGFRFWDSGFWKNHLGGRPYHISALYVIDLKRFREMAAGDVIRATYQQLSQDENSLANLDQDLPNFLQNRVPIFSLPQEWLWCETWCDDESKARAKTIDLCNNPLTKTPKLENAVRIIPEWRDLDEEARSIEERYSSSFASSATATATTAPDAAAAVPTAPFEEIHA